MLLALYKKDKSRMYNKESEGKCLKKKFMDPLSISECGLKFRPGIYLTEELVWKTMIIYGNDYPSSSPKEVYDHLLGLQHTKKRETPRTFEDL